MSQVSYGTITITDTTDIERIYLIYKGSSDNINAPSITWSDATHNDWQTDITLVEGKYIWAITVFKKSGITITRSNYSEYYSDPVCLTGEEGTAGRGISSITIEYGTSADWIHEPSNWYINTPEYNSSTPNYWTKTTINYTSGNPTIKTTQDKALTQAIYDAVVANSVAQHSNENAQGAMSQAASNVNEVKRLWFLKNTSGAPAKPTSSTTIYNDNAANHWTTVRPTVTGYRYYYYCEQTTTGGGIKSWSDVYLDSSELSEYEIGAMKTRFQNFFYPGDSNYPGAYAVGKGTSDGLDITKISTYGYNLRLTPTALSIGYNDIKALEIDGATPALKFYKPSKTSQGAQTAQLDAHGLVLSEGGIKAGTYSSAATDVNQNFVYLSSEDYGTAIQIGSSPSDKTDWRQIIGNKFGVDKAGNLYASNVVIEGKITVGSGSNVYTITEANTTFDTKESAEQVRKSAESAARSANSALTQLGVVEDVVNTINWLAEHGDYSLTEDTVAQSDKLYYERLYIYTKTTDTSINSTKTYYTQSGTGTDADPYVYTAVENPVVADIENYYEATASYAIYDVPEDGNPHELGLYQLDGVDEAVTNYIASHIALTDDGLWITADESGYRILISSDGIRLYSPEGVISTFGENIEFDSSKSQRIGGENEYIEFDHTTGRLNIVADSVSIGSRDASTVFDSIENTLTPMQDQLDNHDEALQNQQNTLNNLTGYVDINTEDSYIRVGKRDADSYVQIDGADTKVAININGKDVAYMNGNRFYAPSAVVTNLYMKTEDNTIGTIGWVMRSNGHLSLKRLR